MKKIAILTLILVLSTSCVAFAGSAFNVGFAGGGHGSAISMSYSNVSHGQHYRGGGRGRHYGHGVRHYRRPMHRSYGHSRHIHRQEGRVYVNDYRNCRPVVVVPSSRRYYYSY